MNQHFQVKLIITFLQDGNVTDDLIPEDDRDAGGLPRILTFSKQTRIMLIRNFFTKEGLVN